MIVNCDRCHTKYRVREDRFPEGGGNIKCPECGHVFFVKPNEVASAPAPVPAAKGPGGLRRATAPVSTMDDNQPTTVGTVPSMLLGGGTGAHSMPGKPPVQAMATSAANEPESWKLKTSFGLVYDFPDTPSLQQWLSAREDLSGYELSKDGQTFKPLSDFPHVASADALKKSGPSPALSRASGSRKALERPKKPPISSPKPAIKPPAAKPKPPVKPRAANLQQRSVNRPPPSARLRGISEEEREEIDREKQANRNLVIFSSVGLLAVFLIVGLQLSGAVDFKKFVGPPPEAPEKPVAARTYAVEPGQNTTPPPQVTTNTERNIPKPPPRAGEGLNGSSPVAPHPTRHNDHIKLLLEQAEKEIRSNKLDDAMRTLSGARGIAPNEPQVFRLMERIYSRKGDSKSAREMRERYKFLEQQLARPNKR